LYTLIDSPITPYSTSSEIKKWISALEDMEKSNQVKDEIDRCNQLLEILTSKKPGVLTEK